MERRGFLHSILALGIAPAIVKAEILMPVRQLILPPSIRNVPLLTIDLIVRDALRLMHANNQCLKGVNANWDKDVVLLNEIIKIRLPARYAR